MTRITPPTPPISSEPPSWTSAISSAIFDGTSSIYDFFKRQLTYPLTPLDPERVLAPEKESNPSFLDSVKKGVSSITKKQCVTVVALVAIGYAYTQLPNVDEVRGRLFGSTQEPSPAKTNPEKTPYDLAHILLGSFATIQTCVITYGVSTLRTLQTTLGTIASAQQNANTESSDTLAHDNELLKELLKQIGAALNALKANFEKGPTSSQQQQILNTVDSLASQLQHIVSSLGVFAKEAQTINARLKTLTDSTDALRSVVFESSATTSLQFKHLTKLISSLYNGRSSMCTPFSPIGLQTPS